MVLWHFVFSAALVFAAKTETYFGEATQKGQLVYREYHTVETDDQGKVLRAKTEYKRPDGQLMAVLASDFTKSLTSPEHSFEDKRFNHKHGIRLNGDEVILYAQNDDKKEETKVLNKRQSGDRVMFGCQGLHYYLRENFDKVTQRKTTPIVFLIPGSLDSYNFELHAKGTSGDLTNYEIEIDNFFLKLFEPSLDIQYDTKTKRLIRYKGLSNLRNDKRKNQSVEITYTYPTDRKTNQADRFRSLLIRIRAINFSSGETDL